MASSAPASGSHGAGAVAQGAFRSVISVITRAYAIALIAVIVLLTYGALRYLVRSLVVPTATPPQIAAVPQRLDESLLHGSRPNWLGLQVVENPRGPLAHYHHFDSWIESDRFNDCTRSGCHATLPHARRPELRAFLNMHATTLHCGVCHMQSDAQPLQLAWYSLRDGKPMGAPPALRTLAWLQRHAAPSVERTDQLELIQLLREAAQDAEGDAQLERIARQIELARPGSDLLARLKAQAEIAVQRVFHGSYGAKLAPRDAAGRPLLALPDSANAVRDWLARGAAATGPARVDMLKAVHTHKREKPLDCLACHRTDHSLVDFAGLGYPPLRVQALTESLIFSMIRHIGEGYPFYLPSFTGPRARDSQPAAAVESPPPASQPEGP